MPGMPVLQNFDATHFLLKDPYRFISRQAKRLKSDVFESRLLFQKTIMMTGPEAARIFTDENLFTRKSAAPEPVRATLFGKGGIQGLDGEAHHHRKELFMSFMTKENVDEIHSFMKHWLNEYVVKWESQDEVQLYPEFQEILTRSVCEWGGVHLPDEEVKERASDLTSLYDYAASFSHHLSVRAARKRCEKWIADLIQDIRDNDIHSGTPLSVFAHFKDVDGKLLDKNVAAVDFLSILRPTIAISVFFLYVIHALHMDAGARQRIKSQEAGFIDNFINEVRRLYPFFPFTVARVKQDFIWGKFHFRKGRRVLLDLYGINHDERTWQRPMEFNPDRFKSTPITPYNFVPQGVGIHSVDHRCPGELFTMELMRGLADYFVNSLEYEVPPQALQINFSRLPAIPESRMIIRNVKKRVPLILTESFTGLHP